jgi:hypothetical protein
MTQLIQQQKINEAASGYFDEKEQKIFKFGVQFAVNEIQPLIVDFAEWTYKNYDYIERIGNRSEWMWKKNNEYFTTKQLLEEFINSKSK